MSASTSATKSNNIDTGHVDSSIHRFQMSTVNLHTACKALHRVIVATGDLRRWKRDKKRGVRGQTLLQGMTFKMEHLCICNFRDGRVYLSDLIFLMRVT